jgi:uncharacterized membrane protein HdeD (DUF308 family)
VSIVTAAPANDVQSMPATADAMSALLARNWGFVLLRGALALLFGVLVVLLPGPAVASLVLLFAAYMLGDGLFAVASAIRAARADERWGWLLLEGVADIAAGAVAFALPGIAVLSFVLLVSAWAIVSGLFMIAAAFRLRADHGRWWLLLGGIISGAWGGLLFLQPGIGAVVLTIWLGAYAAAFGIALIVLAFRLRSRQRGATAAHGGR